MVYIDSGKGNYKVSIQKLKRVLSQRDLINGDHHEDGRCMYVASSRARRLLWIVSTNKEIQDLRNQYNCLELNH